MSGTWLSDISIVLYCVTHQELLTFRTHMLWKGSALVYNTMLHSHMFYLCLYNWPTIMHFPSTFWYTHRCDIHSNSNKYYYTPRFNEVERGGILVSPCPSVHPSVCPSVLSSTILIESISYLYILSSNFRRCVVYNFCFKIKKFEMLANSLNM